MLLYARITNFVCKFFKMNLTFFKSDTFWNSVLVTSVMLATFILPVISDKWRITLFRLVYSLIYFSAIFSLKKRSSKLIVLFFITLILEWLSGIINLPVLHRISNGINIIFFLFIVILLIKQIASAKDVTAGVILSSIAGYLLLGIVFSIFVTFILQYDASAFNIQQESSANSNRMLLSGVSLYWGFVTMASLGYGDIVPLKPYTRSLATFIVITGQFYIAILVAMLVGKFAAQNDFKNSSD